MFSQPDLPYHHPPASDQEGQQTAVQAPTSRPGLPLKTTVLRGPGAPLPRIFYGWYLVGLGLLSSAFIAGINVYTLGVYIQPVTQSLGWTRTMIAGVQSFQTVISGVISPLIGPILDRRGGRELMVLGSILSGLAFLGMSQTRALWQFYLTKGVLYAIGSVCGGSRVVNVAISNWFVRKRGRAIAISAMGLSVAGIFLPPLAATLVDALGWRTAWLVQGLLVWATMILPSALLMRRRPEDHGLLPDGDPPREPGGTQADTRSGRTEAEATRDVVWTPKAALFHPTFWQVILAFGLAGLGMSAMLFHEIPYVMDMGFTTVVAAGALSLQSTASLVTKPVWGLVAERAPVRFCASAEFLCCGSGILALVFATEIFQVYGALFIFGIGIGGVVVLQELVWANYFGRMRLGTIRSLASPFQIFSSAGGPLFAGYLYDLKGSYRTPFLIFVVTYALAILLILFTRPPRISAVDAIPGHDVPTPSEAGAEPSARKTL